MSAVAAGDKTTIQTIQSITIIEMTVNGKKLICRKRSIK